MNEDELYEIFDPVEASVVEIPLFEIIQADDFKNAYKIICEAPAEQIGQVDERGTLFHACVKSREKMLLLLLTKIDCFKISKEDLFFEVRDREGKTVIQKICELDRLDLLKILLEGRYVSMDYKTKNEGNTIFLEACKHGSGLNVKMLEFLFTHFQAKLEDTNLEGRNCFHLACTKLISAVQSNALQFLIEMCKLQVEQKYHNLLSFLRNPMPVDLAHKSEGQFSLEEQLFLPPKADSFGDLILEAVEMPKLEDCLEGMKTLFLLDVPCNEGDSAIHCACISSATSLVETLVKAGTSPNLRNRRGDTPLLLTVKQNNPLSLYSKRSAIISTARSLIKLGAGTIPQHFLPFTSLVAFVNSVKKIYTQETKKARTFWRHVRTLM